MIILFVSVPLKLQFFARVITTQGRIPVKWTAYEALTRGRYTTKSDVYVSKRAIG